MLGEREGEAVQGCRLKEVYRTEDGRQKTPGRETEKPTPGVNSRAEDGISELVNW